jgi:hypothetical protein
MNEPHPSAIKAAHELLRCHSQISTTVEQAANIIDREGGVSEAHAIIRDLVGPDSWDATARAHAFLKNHKHH